MRRGLERRRMRSGAALFALLALGAAAVAGGGLRNSAPKPSPLAIALAWRSVGPEVEPWSGTGLGELVRQALGDRGVVVRPAPGFPHADPPDIPALVSLGKRLDAVYTLGGTVGRSGHRSEIGMRLVRVNDGLEVWSSTFWRDQRDLESLPSELASAINEVLRTEARLRRSQ